MVSTDKSTQAGGISDELREVLSVERISVQISNLQEEIAQIKRLIQSGQWRPCHTWIKQKPSNKQRTVKVKMKKAKRRIRQRVKRSMSKEGTEGKEGATWKSKASLDIDNAVEAVYQKYAVSRKVKERKAILKNMMHNPVLDDKADVSSPYDVVKKFALKDIWNFRAPLVHQKLDILPSDAATRNPFESLEEFFSSSSRNNETSEPQSPVPKPMNIEMLRVESFKHYPLTAKARPIRLARSGFFYTGREDRVECYSCGIIYRNWNEDDNPDEIHRRISPECAHVLNQDRTNVPIHSDAATSSLPDQPAMSMTRQGVAGTYNRPLATPSTQTNAVSVANSPPSPGQNSGNILTPSPSNEMRNVIVNGNHGGPSNNSNNNSSSRQPDIQCGTSTQGELPENPNSVSSMIGNVREQTNPNIPVAFGPSDQVTQGPSTSATNPSVAPPRTPGPHHLTTQTSTMRHPNPQPLSMPPSSTAARGSEAPQMSSRQAMIQRLDPLGISFDRPRYPSYAILNTRVSSFQNWPPHMTQTPREMARAGFLYAGYGDYARCFFCGGGLRNWEAGDDPWVEHARWFPKCAFLRQNKGDEFVALVQEQHRNEQVNRGPPTDTSPQRGNDVSNGDTATSSTPRQSVASPAVQSLAEMGYSQSDITEALEKVKSRKRESDIKAEDILQVLLEGKGDGVVDTQPESIRSDDSNDEKDDNQGAQGLEQGMSSLNCEETKSLMEENKRLKDQRLCKICLDQDACIAMLPCGHLCCCAECAPAMRKCPICRQFVKGTVKTWLV